MSLAYDTAEQLSCDDLIKGLGHKLADLIRVTGRSDEFICFRARSFTEEGPLIGEGETAQEALANLYYQV